MKVPSRVARVRARVARARVVVRAGVPQDLKTQSRDLDLKTQSRDLSLDLNLVQDLDLDLSLETKTQIALALPQANSTTRE